MRCKESEYLKGGIILQTSQVSETCEVYIFKYFFFLLLEIDLKFIGAQA